MSANIREFKSPTEFSPDSRFDLKCKNSCLGIFEHMIGNNIVIAQVCVVRCKKSEIWEYN